MNHLKFRSNTGFFCALEIGLRSFMCLPSFVESIQAPCPKVEGTFKTSFSKQQMPTKYLLPRSEAWVNWVP